MQAALLAFARKFVDRDTAEDIVQDAFVRAMEHGGDSGAELPLPYLRRIVRNLAFDLYERRSRDRRYCEAVRPDAAGARPAGIDCSALEEDLRERLAELSQRQWESLVMTVVHGLTEHEAASAADISRSAVTGSRQRAISVLRHALPGDGPARRHGEGRLAG